MDKFEHGFGTQLGAVLLWRRVRSGGVMLAAWSHQTSSSSSSRQQAAAGSHKVMQLVLIRVSSRQAAAAI